MTNRIYRSARGKPVDLGALILKNENTRSVGNMNVNTRGDKLNAKNEVIEPKTQIMEKHYESQINTSEDVIPTSARHAKQIEREKYMAERMKGTEKAHRKAVKAQIKDGANPDPAVLEEPVASPEVSATVSGGLAAAIARAKEIKQEKLKSTKQQTQSKSGVNRL